MGRDDADGATALLGRLEDELAEEIGGLRRFMAELRPPAGRLRARATAPPSPSSSTPA